MSRRRGLIAIAALAWAAPAALHAEPPSEGDDAPTTVEAAEETVDRDAEDAAARVEAFDPFLRAEGVRAGATEHDSAALAGQLPSPGPDGGEDDESGGEDGDASELSPLPGDQEIGVRTGVALGGRTTPGGYYVAGHYLYRLAGRDWFDGGVAFTFGSGREACFRARDDAVLCRHGFASGFAAEVLAGVARYIGEPDEPVSRYLRGGIGARVVAFPGDEVRGLAIPAWFGAGVRARVHDNVSIVGGAEVRVGPAWMTRDIGIEPHASFAITAGVDFRLD